MVAAFCVFAIIRREWRVAGALAAGAVVVFVGELGWFWSQSGDLLYRSAAMANHNKTRMAAAANEILFYRLLNTYPYMMIVPSVHFGLHSVFALAVAGFAVLRYRSDATILLCLWAAIPWLYLNFGTTSFEYFWALPAYPRYIAIVYTPLLILAALMFARWSNRTAIVALVVLFTVGIGSAHSTRRTGYGTADIAELKAAVIYARLNRERFVRFGPSTTMRPTARRRALMLIAPDLDLER